MGRFQGIPRTAAFAWSQDIARPAIATGTKAGAVDADFSNETILELWDLQTSHAGEKSDLKPVASIGTDSRFYDIAWSKPSETYPEGVVAGALENGSLDLWDAAKLRSGAADALISRTTKHSGAIKALQFNPHRPELLATAGAKGELYITDLNNPENPFRLGNTAARADDFDCLDWNKKVSHILVTGSSGGFVTIWDVKAKKESLTLNNYGRKPVSAVAWNPDVPTKLATAISTDQDPLILLWDLRNSSAPERILKGHDQGVLSLAWCAQDNDLLLSCGKDNRNICWNPHTGEALAEFPIVTNWTFQTGWNPENPNLVATASFAGEIAIHTIQNTNNKANEKPATSNQAVDGADFFAQVQTETQGVSFSLPKPPKWLQRPVGVSFGFGGKVVTFGPADEQSKSSKVTLSTFTSDKGIETSISEFQQALSSQEVSKICEARIDSAPNEESKEDWKVIHVLVSDSPRKKLLDYLGFSTAANQIAANSTQDTTQETTTTEETKSETHLNGFVKGHHSRLSQMFGGSGETQNFLSDLAASKGARTNNPFHIFSGSEADVDKEITKALMLGSFEKAADLCVAEKRMSDAFMIAICGGQKCIDKVQSAYFAQQSDAPNYLRLLASVVGKNLWDVVYNADLTNWKEVMATLCTFADEQEFPDLCDALGDRLEESQATRKSASFCYLAGSKLEKVIPIWVQEMQETEASRREASENESEFSIHVQVLQQFIEKVSIYRKASNYKDADVLEKTAGWKLEKLYSKYAEYADVVAAHGYLDLADQFLELLPAQYPAAEVARNRVRQAIKKVTPAAKAQNVSTAQTTSYNRAPAFTPAQPQGTPSQLNPTAAAIYAPKNPYAPTGISQQFQPSQDSSTPYTPVNSFNAAPPQRAPPPSSGPPRKAADGSNWNDLPDSFAAVKPSTSRRSTPIPATAPVGTPFNNPPGPPGYGPATTQYTNQRAASPLPPPPKVGAPPQQIGQPPAQPPSLQRLPSSAANSYAPQQPGLYSAQQPPASIPLRGQSPYNPPPSAAPPSNRYAPAPNTQASAPQFSAAGPPSAPSARPIAPPPNPYAPQQSGTVNQQYAPPRQQTPSQGPPSGPPLAARGPPPGPPRSGPPVAAPDSRPSTAQSQRSGTSSAARYPPGDRSHIPPESQPIYEVFNSEMQRVKALAPPAFAKQVEDTEKRFNILFDLLNNDTLGIDILASLKLISQALQAREYDQAQALHTQTVSQQDVSASWVVAIKRLIAMSKATPIS